MSKSFHEHVAAFAGHEPEVWVWGDPSKFAPPCCFFVHLNIKVQKLTLLLLLIVDPNGWLNEMSTDGHIFYCSGPTCSALSSKQLGTWSAPILANVVRSIIDDRWVTSNSVVQFMGWFSFIVFHWSKQRAGPVLTHQLLV